MPHFNNFLDAGGSPQDRPIEDLQEPREPESDAELGRLMWEYRIASRADDTIVALNAALCRVSWLVKKARKEGPDRGDYHW